MKEYMNKAVKGKLKKVAVRKKIGQETNFNFIMDEILLAEDIIEGTD